jgi:hypothetical protein
VNISAADITKAAAVIGLVFFIASLVDLNIKVVSRVHEFAFKISDIPETFRALSTRLPLLKASLERIIVQARIGRLPNNITEVL